MSALFRCYLDCNFISFVRKKRRVWKMKTDDHHLPILILLKQNIYIYIYHKKATIYCAHCQPRVSTGSDLGRGHLPMTMWQTDSERKKKKKKRSKTPDTYACSSSSYCSLSSCCSSSFSSSFWRMTITKHMRHIHIVKHNHPCRETAVLYMM